VQVPDEMALRPEDLQIFRLPLPAVAGGDAHLHHLIGWNQHIRPGASGLRACGEEVPTGGVSVAITSFHHGIEPVAHGWRRSVTASACAGGQAGRSSFLAAGQASSAGCCKGAQRAGSFRGRGGGLICRQKSKQQTAASATSFQSPQGVRPASKSRPPAKADQARQAASRLTAAAALCAFIEAPRRAAQQGADGPEGALARGFALQGRTQGDRPWHQVSKIADRAFAIHGSSPSTVLAIKR